jgi:hypothetical protein
MPLPRSPIFKARAGLSPACAAIVLFIAVLLPDAASLDGTMDYLVNSVNAMFATVKKDPAAHEDYLGFLKVGQ